MKFYIKQLKIYQTKLFAYTSMELPDMAHLSLKRLSAV
ncbi:hypothetical protein CF161_28865 [Pseudomonas sp. CF161]|nr:hypothetical protein CF161_28865 [Pseudomonas sp. CF161]